MILSHYTEQVKIFCMNCINFQRQKIVKVIKFEENCPERLRAPQDFKNLIC